MAGRRPTPTMIKIANGNPGRRPLNTREPQPADALPKCPAHFDEIASAEWKRVIKVMGHLKVWTAADVGVLEEYCTWYSMHRLAWLGLQDGLTYEMPNGQRIPKPEVRIMATAAQRLHAAAIELGMTPAARSKVQIVSEPEDEFGDFLNRRSAARH